MLFNYKRDLNIMLVLSILVYSVSGCKKFVSVSPPVTSTTGSSVYYSDGTAIGVLTGLYATMSTGGIFTGINGLSLYCGLSADEFELFPGVPTTDNKFHYFTNSLYTNLNGASAGSESWSPLYNYIFLANSAIEGLTNGSDLTEAVKLQLLGEAKFLRAFYYFYLVNMFGDIPLILTTDYKLNTQFSRTPKGEVYDQIIKDLKDAKELLAPKYLDGTLLKTSNERIRPIRAAASALLARVYLYYKDWLHAEFEATEVINNTSLFSLVDLNETFLKNSKEVIWQLQPVNSGWNTEDAKVFIIPSSGLNASDYPVSLSSYLLNSFEPNDVRKMNWIDSIMINATSYFYPYKYKSASQGSPVSEYLVVLRLAEQYLIRAEAKAQLGNPIGAIADLDAIRLRAGLTPYSGSNILTSLLSAILRERQVELFSEWGHRWFDLKRMGSVDFVMSSVTPLKASGAAWQSFQQLYPLPINEIQKDKNLVQNTGY